MGKLEISKGKLLHSVANFLTVLMWMWYLNSDIQPYNYL